MAPSPAPDVLRRLARDLRALHLASEASVPTPWDDRAALAAAVDELEVDVATSPARHAEVLEALRRLDDAALGRLGSAASAPWEGRPADVLLTDHDETVPAGADRRRRGAWYTPPALVGALLDRSLDPLLAERSARDGRPAIPSDLRIVDPTCGTGRMLLAAHRRVLGAARAIDATTPASALVGVVRGVDADPDAVEVLRLALWLELADAPTDDPSDPTVSLAEAAACIAHGDALPVTTTALGAPPLDWTAAFPDVLGDTDAEATADGVGGFDLVVGNPPFANPLRGAGPVTRAAATVLAERFDGDVRGYANPAAAFLALAVELARPDGGRVALVQPLSTLAARDAGPVRRRVLQRATLTDVWVDTDGVFDAGVRTCAIVARRGAPGPSCPAAGAGSFPRCWAGLPAVEVPAPSSVVTALGAGDAEGPWGPLVASAFGIPAVTSAASATLGDRCRATADFRDQYYGLVPAVVDAGSGADPMALPDGVVPLATSGLIGVGACWWGRRPVRLHKRRLDAPAVSLAALDDDAAMTRWAQQRQVPKVLLATQGPVVEAFVDVDGRWLPSVPVVTVAVEPEDAWAVAAALVSPATAAWAAAHRLGAALAPGAITLAARHVGQVPLPVHADAWRDAAEALEAAQRAATGDDPEGRHAALVAFADASVAAAGLDRATACAVRAWWLGRVPSGGAGRMTSGRLGP